mmetsp:Transcript_43222/g.80036  ORF Transcript_43222/g.80036 Transcript_43222/m.80036 type:complete len:148 (-) Transcript_43222:346-789(-)
MTTKSPQFDCSNDESKGMSAGNPLESSIYDSEMSAGDPENLSRQELVQKVHALSEENAQLKLELKKEKMANAGASEVKMGRGRASQASSLLQWWTWTKESLPKTQTRSVRQHLGHRSTAVWSLLRMMVPAALSCRHRQESLPQGSPV